MRKMMQRSLSCLLTLAMVVTMLMTSTLAAEKSAKLGFIVLSKPICFFFSKYGNITISIWIVIMKIATKLF